MISLLLVFACFCSFASSQRTVDKMAAKGLSAKVLSDSPISLWMQQSGVAVRVCQQVKSVQAYSSGLSPLLTQVSVGRCQPLLVKATAHVTAKQEVCPGMQACVPTMSEVIPIRTADGISHVKSALDCTCAPLPSGCQRRPWLRVFYRGTKYERVVDVGKCAGNCGNKKCQPLSIKTVAIKTPNGRKLVQVVEKCGCQSSCYRMSYKKAYPVVSSRLANSTRTKVIDVGMCSGKSSCSGSVKGKCLYWVFSSNKSKDQPSNHKVCLIHSKTRRQGCYADKTRTVTLNITTTPNMEVQVIESCACS